MKADLDRNKAKGKCYGASGYGIKDRWYKRRGARLVPAPYASSASAELDVNDLIAAANNQDYEDSFQRTEIDLSGDHRGHKEVHFNRVLADAGPGDVGGLLVHNAGEKSAINVDLTFTISCHQP